MRAIKISFPKNSTLSDEWITPEGMKGHKNKRTYPMMKKETAESVYSHNSGRN